MPRQRPVHPIVNALVERRRQLRLSQRRCAAAAQRTGPAISYIEIGRTPNPGIRTLEAYADALGCDLVVQLRVRPKGPA